jgi:hypothetical protein
MIITDRKYKLMSGHLAENLLAGLENISLYIR